MLDMSSLTILFQIGPMELIATIYDGQLWFAARQVSECLPVAKCFIQRTCKEEKVTEADQPQKKQTPRNDDYMIDERHLYRMLLAADAEAAKPFQRWVAGSVWPALQVDRFYLLEEERLEGVEKDDRSEVTDIPQVPVESLDWLADVVLPTIRRDQMYIVGEEHCSITRPDQATLLAMVFSKSKAKAARWKTRPNRREHLNLAKDFALISESTRSLQ